MVDLKILVLLWLFASMLLIILELYLWRHNPKSLDTTEAVLFMNQSSNAVLDLRPVESFEQSHIRGAKHCVWPPPDLDLMKKQLSKRKGGFLLIDEQGLTAKKAGRVLRNLLPEKTICFMKGGMRQWQDEKQPLVYPANH